MKTTKNIKNSGIQTVMSVSARVGLIFAISLFIGVAGCDKTDSSSKTPAAKKLPLVTTMPVQSGEIAQTIQLTGAVEPFRLALLASPAEGPVVNLQVREGDAVKAGDVLVTIGRKTAVDAQIASLKEELKKEADNLNRTRRLVESKALAGEQLDMAKADFEKVSAELARARETERDYAVSAPFSGMVSKRLVSEGDFVAPRAGLIEIYEPATLVLRTTVSERYAARLKADMLADIILDAYPDRTFTGRISRLYPYLDAQMRTRTIEIRINEPVDLLPGMFGRIQLTLESIPDALTIPVPALLITPKGDSIVFVVENGKAIQRKVKTGMESEGRIQIFSGVNPGEQVIVSGHEKLKDGAEIRLPAAGVPGTPANGKAKDEGAPPESGSPDKTEAGDK